jgi:bifunctional phosphoglucose/phosphomannose isomerase
MEAALSKQCQIACITSGGKVQSWSEKYGIPYVKVNGGLPPRSQFGQSTVQLSRLLNAFKIVDDSIFSSLDLAAQKLSANQSEIETTAAGIANQINQTIPAVYIGSDYEGVAVRWRQQIGENAKMICFHHQFPEMNHNDLVGWEGGDSKFSAILLRNEDDAERVKVRMDICKEIFKEKNLPRMFRWHSLYYVEGKLKRFDKLKAKGKKLKMDYYIKIKDLKRAKNILTKAEQFKQLKQSFTSLLIMVPTTALNSQSQVKRLF